MIDNLINMKYPGDSKIYDFYTQWHTILEGMRAEDVPPKRTLRDILYKKIRDSTVMKFDLSLYDQFADSDPMKTYDLLMSFIVKRIKLDREKKNQQEKEKAWTEITNPKPGTPATKAEKEKAKKEKEQKEKEKKEKEKKEKEKKEKEKKEKEKKEKERKEKEKKEKEKGDMPDKPSAPVVHIHILVREKEEADDRIRHQVTSAHATSILSRGIVGMGRIARSRMIPSSENRLRRWDRRVPGVLRPRVGEIGRAGIFKRETVVGVISVLTRVR